MKCGVRNKTAKLKLKMVIFKLLVLSYMHTTLYFSFLRSKNLNKLCENTRKGLNFDTFIKKYNK